jgi:hypothetical protein
LREGGGCRRGKAIPAHARRGSIMMQAQRQRVRWGVVAALLGLVSVFPEVHSADAASLPLAEKIIPLKPSITFVKASFLTGEIEGLRVVERIEPGTGKVVGAPMLEATLTVSNDSRDHAARLLGGKIEYIDETGKSIAMTGTSFIFTKAAANRLDPGQTVSQPMEIAFPPTALKPDALREVSLELTYLPIPYQTDTVRVPVYLGG